MTTPLLGAIADDLTGACDLAAGVTGGGLSAAVLLGPPDPSDWPGDRPRPEFVVVALKSRTAPRATAVEESVAAAQCLLTQGVPRLYQKYCSTFDSTDAGNIGPVADALARAVAAHRGAPASRLALTVGTPATPAAGRTQYQGHLFVGDRLLAESSMREHPLTPMRDSDLVRVLGRQTPGEVALLPHETVRAGPAAIRAEVRGHCAGRTAHLLADAVCDADLDALALALSDTEDFPRPLVTGGAAGLGAALARRAATGRVAPPGSASALPAVPARNRLIISGSASARTREQVAAFTGPAVPIDPLRLASEGGLDGNALDELLGEVALAVRQAAGAPVLVSATDRPDRVRRIQESLGAHTAASVVEQALARVAAHAVAALDVSHLVVAGGETSGAVAAALGVRALRVGRSAAVGVPWMVAESGAAAGSCALLFKSGNFGDADLFSTAWECAP